MSTWSLLDLLREDESRYLNRLAGRPAGRGWKAHLGAWMSVPLQSVLLYRLSHWLWRKGWLGAGRALAQLNSLLFKTYLPASASIGPGFWLPHPQSTAYCGHAGRGLTLYAGAACLPNPEEGCDPDRGPQLGDDVTVGAHAVLLGPIRVGDRTRVLYCVALSKDAPADTRVVSAAIKAAIRPASHGTADAGHDPQARAEVIQ